MHLIDLVFVSLLGIVILYLMILVLRYQHLRRQRERALMEAFSEARTLIQRPIVEQEVGSRHADRMEISAPPPTPSAAPATAAFRVELPPASPAARVEVPRPVASRPPQ